LNKYSIFYAQRRKIMSHQRTITRADLHVHSHHSKHPSEWILQRLGASESYTPIETIYRLAKEQGNTFVTITDHNTIDGACELRRLHPDDCFISTEATAYFPEDGCKVHILCYDITVEQFAVIQRARDNIYNLRDYLRQENIACSVAHATYSVNEKLTLEHIEKLLVLFDVFEGINGTRGQESNRIWQLVLDKLDPEEMARLSMKHHIDPWSATSWRKGQTGGSDDHAGLFAGFTWTRAEATSKHEFIQAIREKSTVPGGRTGDFKSLAYGIYKITSEHVRQKQGSTPGLTGLLASILFQDRGPSLRERFFLKKLGLRRSARDQIMSRFLNGLWTITHDAASFGADWQITQAYDALAVLLDDLMAEIGRSLEKGIKGQSSEDIFQYISSVFPALVFATPFISTLRILNKNRALNNQLSETFQLRPQGSPKRVLWFSDTIADLNGVSVTINELADCAFVEEAPLRFVGCLTAQEQHHPIANRLLQLPCVFEITPTFYNAHTIRFPSLLRSLDLITQERPDKIVISTPGPVGLTGYLAARLLGIPCEGIYHTDFTKQAEEIIGDRQMIDSIDTYIRWFYARMDIIHVPSQYYMTQLADKGHDRSRIRLFQRGFNPAYGQVLPQDVQFARAQWFSTNRDHVTLLYTGRLSKEKNLDVLASIFEALRAQKLPVRLLIAGDGPERSILEQRLASHASHVCFAGRIDSRQLKSLYLLSDILVFPSTSDTFGMSVLEAQTLGLPALVSQFGGPQEIIIHGQTGYALDISCVERWIETCQKLVQARLTDPIEYQAWRDEIKHRFKHCPTWADLINKITEKESASVLPVENADKGFHLMREAPTEGLKIAQPRSGVKSQLISSD
jgi:glycosyltransferase involved in cell wall biosynthesis/predicted metal-dependent phosphoesterase TrpH